MTATPMLKVIWSPAEFFDPTSTRKRMRRNLVQVYQPMLKIHATLQGKKETAGRALCPSEISHNSDQLLCWNS